MLTSKHRPREITIKLDNPMQPQILVDGELMEGWLTDFRLEVRPGHDPKWEAKTEQACDMPGVRSTVTFGHEYRR